MAKQRIKMTDKNASNKLIASRTKTFCFLSYLHEEKILHKEHRNKHVIQKLLLSGGILGIGQLISIPETFFFIILCIPFVCLVHDIYIFAEDFKVKRVGQFVLHDKTKNMWKDDLALWWEQYVDKRREKVALWGSMLYTALLTGLAGAIPLSLKIVWKPLHYIAYSIGVGLASASIIAIFIVAKKFDAKLGTKADESLDTNSPDN